MQIDRQQMHRKVAHVIDACSAEFRLEFGGIPFLGAFEICRLELGHVATKFGRALLHPSRMHGCAQH